MIISGGSDNSLPITGLATGGLLVIGLGLFGSGALARLASARRINDQGPTWPERDGDGGEPRSADALPYRRGHETPGIVRAGCLLLALTGTKHPASFVPASLVPVHRSAPVDVRPPPLSNTRPQPSTDDNQNRSIRAGGS